MPDLNTDILDSFRYASQPKFNDKLYVSFKTYVTMADTLGIEIVESNAIGEDEFYLAQGNRLGKQTLQRNYIRDLRAKLEKEQDMGLTAISKSLAQSDRSFMDYVNDQQSQFNYLRDMLSKQQVAMAQDKILIGDGSQITSGIQAIYRDEENKRYLPPVEEDRPTLATRLDKAEEERDVARRQLELFEQQRRKDMDQYNAVVRQRDAFEARAIRAEAIAKKFDFVVSDLEKCRRDMGEHRFKEVVAQETVLHTAGQYQPTLTLTSAQDVARDTTCCHCRKILPQHGVVRDTVGYAHARCAKDYQDNSDARSLKMTRDSRLLGYKSW
jgi:hypothetical protein